MAVKRLTEPMLARITPPKDGRLEFMDDLVRGLCLRVSKTGRRTFNIIYKVDGRQFRRNIGQYPDIGVQEARKIARQALASHGNSITYDNSLADVAEQFLEYQQHSIRTAHQQRRNLELHVLPMLGSVKLADLTAMQIHKLLDGIRDSGKIGAARETRKHIGSLLNWAACRGLIQASPIAGMLRRDLRPNPQAGRALSLSEIKRCFQAATNMSYPFGPLFCLLMLTGQRRNDWAKAKWSELDGANLVISASRYKSARDQIVPLPENARKIVESLPNIGEFMFTTGRNPVSGFSRAKSKLDLHSGLTTPYRIHDFRVTCETHLAELGYPLEVRDAVLGHSRPGLQRTYNKFDYLKEKQDALEQYARRLS